MQPDTVIGVGEEIVGRVVKAIADAPRHWSRTNKGREDGRIYEVGHDAPGDIVEPVIIEAHYTAKAASDAIAWLDAEAAARAAVAAVGSEAHTQAFAQGAEGWLPISSAPKDKWLLVGWWDAAGVWRSNTATWEPSDGEWTDYSARALYAGSYAKFPATHWRPLPPPPAGKPGGE